MKIIMIKNENRLLEWQCKHIKSCTKTEYICTWVHIHRRCHRLLPPSLRHSNCDGKSNFANWKHRATKISHYIFNVKFQYMSILIHNWLLQLKYQPCVRGKHAAETVYIVYKYGEFNVSIDWMIENQYKTHNNGVQCQLSSSNHPFSLSRSLALSWYASMWLVIDFDIGIYPSTLWLLWASFVAYGKESTKSMNKTIACTFDWCVSVHVSGTMYRVLNQNFILPQHTREITVKNARRSENETSVWMWENRNAQAFCLCACREQESI